MLIREQGVMEKEEAFLRQFYNILTRRLRRVRHTTLVSHFRKSDPWGQDGSSIGSDSKGNDYFEYHRVEKQPLHHSNTEVNISLSDPASAEFSCDTFVVNIKRSNTIPVSRGACQRHHGSQLTRKMDELRRQSWRGDLHILREEEETEEDKLVEVPRSDDNEDNFQVPCPTKPPCDLEKEHFSPLEMYFLNLWLSIMSSVIFTTKILYVSIEEDCCWHQN